jgi:hypothetical protein
MNDHEIRENALHFFFSSEIYDAEKNEDRELTESELKQVFKDGSCDYELTPIERYEDIDATDLLSEATELYYLIKRLTK